MPALPARARQSRRSPSCAASASRARISSSAGTAAALLLGPVALEASLIFVDITPALFVVLTVGSVLAWRGFRVRGLVNPVSGLPNLNALRSNRHGRSQALIVARILNYSEIVATLPGRERAPARRADRRPPVGRRRATAIFYHGDGGIFAWFEEPQLPFGNHIEALYSLFRNPARVDGMSIDLAISFGVEIGSGRSLANRLGSALVAAEEAAHDGLKWKFYDPDSLQDASWKLSILSQLDSADRQGRGVGRLPAQAGPHDPADHRRRGARPLDPPRERARSPHPNSSPPPSSTTASAS